VDKVIRGDGEWTEREVSRLGGFGMLEARTISVANAQNSRSTSPRCLLFSSISTCAICKDVASILHVKASYDDAATRDYTSLDNEHMVSRPHNARGLKLELRQGVSFVNFSVITLLAASMI